MSVEDDARASAGDGAKVDLGWDQPPHLIDQQGQDARFGVAIDDHCYVVLMLDPEGCWRPAQWLPPYVAKRLGEIADMELLEAD